MRDVMLNALTEAEAMSQALEVHRSGVLADTPIAAQTRALLDVARSKKLFSLQDALQQRYPEEFA